MRCIAIVEVEKRPLNLKKILNGKIFDKQGIDKYKGRSIKMLILSFGHGY